MNSYSEKFLLFLFITLLNNISRAATYTFTNPGATGENGPNQNQINSEYAGTDLANSVTINSPGVQEWVVPVTAKYEIEVWGAQGGSGGWYSIQNYSSTGGLGGYAKGSITLSASIGWLHAHPSQEDDFWFWSQEYKWLYILGNKDGKAAFHGYSIDQGI